MRHHLTGTYRGSLVAILRAQGTQKGCEQGATAVAELMQSSPIVQVCWARQSGFAEGVLIQTEAQSEHRVITLAPCAACPAAPSALAPHFGCQVGMHVCGKHHMLGTGIAPSISFVGQLLPILWAEIQDLEA